MLLEGVTGHMLIISLIVADLAVCVVVVLYFFRGRARGEETSIDTARLRKLIHTLGGLVKESDRASRNLLDALNDRHRRTEQLFREMDTKERQMARTIREAEQTIQKSDDFGHTHKYSEVSRLADLGLDVEEIARRVELPKGEIELILGLKR